MNVLSGSDLRDQLRVLIRRLGILQKGEAECCGVTLSQCHAIVELGRAETLSVVELAEILNLDKSTTSRNIDNLVARCLVIRETDPDDRRCVILRLSNEGQTLFCQINRSMEEYFETVLALIPADKRSIVAEGIGELVKAVAQADDCCSNEAKG